MAFLQPGHGTSGCPWPFCFGKGGEQTVQKTTTEPSAQWNPPTSFNRKGRVVKTRNPTPTRADGIQSLLTFKRSDVKMRRELWNQGLMYLIVSLLVFLALPLISYLA